MMTLATAVWWGRWWYDTLLVAFIIVFFVLEAFLLFRRSRLGWAMTGKCVALVAIFSYSLLNPTVPLRAEDVSSGAVVVRVLLGVSLAWVIYELWALRRGGGTVTVAGKVVHGGADG